MDWIQQWQSKLNKQNGVAPLVRTGGSRHTGLAALPYRNIHPPNFFSMLGGGIICFCCFHIPSKYYLNQISIPYSAHVTA